MADDACTRPQAGDLAGPVCRTPEGVLVAELAAMAAMEWQGVRSWGNYGRRADQLLTGNLPGR